MDERDFDSCVTAEVTAGQMQKIYLRLEDEARPHAVRISKSRPHIKRVAIYCDAKDVAHFNTIVSDENKTEI